MWVKAHLFLLRSPSYQTPRPTSLGDVSFNYAFYFILFRGRVYHSICVVMVRDQLAGVVSFLPSCGSLGFAAGTFNC